MSRLQFGSGTLVELYPFSKGKGLKEKEVRKREKQVGEKGRGMREREIDGKWGEKSGGESRDSGSQARDETREGGGGRRGKL